jgi:thiol:disulfide interchange protein DsbD
MIPITLSVLGSQSLESRSKKFNFKSFLISIVYVHGIATTYSVLGLAAAQSGALFGAYLANTWVVAVLSVIFIALGLSFYGLYNIQVPSFLRNKLGTRAFQKNYLGAYLSGLVAGVVASPCVGPVLVALLAHVAKSQNMVLGFLYLFTYAMGLGLIFIVLGTFTGLINKLPKSGPWMNSIKFIFGSTLILMSAYYLKPILSESHLHIYIGMLFILIAGLNGLFAPTQKRLLTLLQKTFMIMIFITGSALILKGFLQPTHEPDPSSSTQWQNYSDELIATYKGKKIIMIDFWAEWCEACHTLEKQTFSDPQVKAILNDFLLVKFDATHDTDEISKVLSQYNVTGLPFILFIDIKGEIRTDLILTGYEPATSFLKRLEKLKQ